MGKRFLFDNLLLRERLILEELVFSFFVVFNFESILEKTRSSFSQLARRKLIKIILVGVL